jgi:hypothetical protein
MEEHPQEMCDLGPCGTPLKVKLIEDQIEVRI